MKNGVTDIFTAIRNKDTRKLKKYARQALSQAAQIKPLEPSVDKYQRNVGHSSGVSYDA